MKKIKGYIIVLLFFTSLCAFYTEVSADEGMETTGKTGVGFFGDPVEAGPKEEPEEPEEPEEFVLGERIERLPQTGEESSYLYITAGFGLLGLSIYLGRKGRQTNSLYTITLS